MPHTPFGTYASPSQGIVAIDPASLSWEVLLDSRQIPVVANGTPIALWPDTSGNGRDANPVPGFNPLYRPAASPNGLPLADFGAVANSQMFGTLPPAGLNNSLGFSIYLWYSLDNPVASAGAGDTQLIFGSDFANGWRTAGSFFQGAGDTRPEVTTNAANLIPAASVQATSGKHLLTAIFSPPSGTGTATVYYDGTQIASGIWSATPNTTYLVSGNSVQNIWLRGRLGFAAIGRRNDSTRTRKGLEKYLRDHWG